MNPMYKKFVIAGIFMVASATVISFLLANQIVTSSQVDSVSSVCTAVAVILAYLSYIADHERSRRERAIDLLQSWAHNLDYRASAARKFAEKLNRDQAQKLFLQQPFVISSEHRELLISCLTAESRQRIEQAAESDNICVQANESTEIRWQLVCLLNRLEAVLSARRYHVADGDIIKEQFRYLVSPVDGHYLLKTFRTVAGEPRDWKAVHEFALEVESEDYRVPASSKSKLA